MTNNDEPEFPPQMIAALREVLLSVKELQRIAQQVGVSVDYVDPFDILREASRRVMIAEAAAPVDMSNVTEVAFNNHPSKTEREPT